MIRRFSLLLLLLLIAAPLAADVPSPEQFLGYKLGERFTSWERIAGYFDALKKSSDKIDVQPFGETYEHRPLIYATITSPKNRASLEQIRKNAVAVGSAVSTTEARAAEIVKTNPAVVWLAFGVHGDESSSAEAAMQVAYELVSDPANAAVLENCVVIIDPLQNPDGRERYVQWFTRTRGAEADPNPDAGEHQQPWPGGRYNHYLVDMNRDWTWSSQQEVRARIRLYQQWYPQVFVDFHEMGYQSSYFFPPDANPINTNISPDVEKWLDIFGRANAQAFSRKGWPFFVAERFDLFYPGYGDSWPALHGSIGMTYEVAGHGRAGSAILREDGVVYTLGDRIQRHYTTAMATVQTASAHRQELINYTWRAMRSQVDSGKNVFLIPPGAPNFRPMLDMLRRQDVEIGISTAPVTLKASRVDTGAGEQRTFPAGTAVISTRQPLGGVANTLLERTPVFSKGFLEEQKEKVRNDEADDFYDLTTWSLPLAQNVETWFAPLPAAIQTKPYEDMPEAATFRAGSYGYLVDGLDPALYRAAGRMLEGGIKFSVSDDKLPYDSKTYARGSLLVFRNNNTKEGVDAVLQRIATETGASFVPLESGWTGGTALGSEKIHFVRDPKIALVGGAGIGSTAYGMLWYTLDIDSPIPHSNLALDTLRNVDLDKYRVLVFPDGEGYLDRLGKRGVEKLQAWIKNGGTVVAVKGGAAFLREKEVEISKLKTWAPPKKKDADESAPPPEERYNDYRIPGSAFRTSMNGRSYLTFGVQKSPPVLIEGTAALLPVSHRVDNIVTIEKETPLLSGFAWPESIDRMKGSAYMVSEPYGKGAVITFADEPNYRLFWRGTLPLFMNALLYSPTFRD
jgi:Zinc carboxypeptidase